ncbi:hypothetical protein CT0861_06924 [Colletotrichum tofieldiae]|uniref:Uncharacterized protein n=1 Tax=Colletotrichum tofieldiae TaxID=708197 RepID=A0A166RXT4_9PEZI|nr:hypothetical protein CT0861_06924 [Colletotrichum tofieldiae]
MGAHSEESAYNGHSSSKALHRHSTKEPKKQLAKRRTSMYNNQPPSEEPSAYQASSNSANVSRRKEQDRARLEAEMERLMSQFNGT